MPIKKITEYECDICSRTKKSNDATMPTGWIKFEVDDIWQERTQHKKIICKLCNELIDAAKKKI